MPLATRPATRSSPAAARAAVDQAAPPLAADAADAAAAPCAHARRHVHRRAQRRGLAAARHWRPRLPVPDRPQVDALQQVVVRHPGHADAKGRRLIATHLLLTRAVQPARHRWAHSCQLFAARLATDSQAATSSRDSPSSAKPPSPAKLPSLAKQLYHQLVAGVLTAWLVGRVAAAAGYCCFHHRHLDYCCHTLAPWLAPSLPLFWPACAPCACEHDMRKCAYSLCRR